MDEAEADSAFNIAIVGRPNVGKSSLLNRLVGKERAIVSDVAGTTRDAIDALVTHEKQEYRFIDTAGIRRRKKVRAGPCPSSQVSMRPCSHLMRNTHSVRWLAHTNTFTSITPTSILTPSPLLPVRWSTATSF